MKLRPTPFLFAAFALLSACSEERRPHDPILTRDSGVLPDGGGADADSGTLPGTRVLFRVRVPDTTPAGSPVFIAGSFQGWNPGSPEHALTAVEARLYQIELSFEPGTALEYKFTRGSWETVEKGPNGEEIQNRTLLVGDVEETVEAAVDSWRDATPRPSTITGDVRTISVPGFLDGRRVWVYLPPGYDAATERYPVLYMLDGQNVFDQATSFAGEWEVDETLERMIPAGEVSPVIVVAVDNGDDARIDEYTPWVDDGLNRGGDGAEHLQAITDVLLPYVNSNYRTLSGPENTGLSGSSLGGLMTLYATYARPDVFGRNAALSPSIWWADRRILSFAEGAQKPPARVWMDMGTAEDVDAIAELRLMRDVMVNQGFVLDLDLKIVEEAGGGHNEAAWARRFPAVVGYLFPPR